MYPFEDLTSGHMGVGPDLSMHVRGAVGLSQCRSTIQSIFPILQENFRDILHNLNSLPSVLGGATRNRREKVK